ncbi:winged helix-turn-helix transcriptional regulator [Thermoflexibacter ruber]|uniref:HxlR-like helix-turn-helix n=1 Tax=Thermoflexibacter ruber TaxID=1003 RepID=A0A1I2IMN4_9BACT|nr:winged helix-turn-helix transcriptional regulator [Thermoflexibacter ruber]SFF41791.1 HxlR-like helix-turn-helix [Thermoflexibacter ruber]
MNKQNHKLQTEFSKAIAFCSYYCPQHKVEYSLTEFGKTLIPALEAIAK